MAPRKPRKTTKTTMRQKIANLNAKRLQACVSAASTVLPTFVASSSSPALDATIPTSFAPEPALEKDTVMLEPVHTPARQSNSTYPSESASKRKISFFPREPAPAADLPTTVADLATVAKLYRDVLCPLCKNPGLQLSNNLSNNRSLAVSLELWCPTCEENISTSYTSKRIAKGQAFDVNRRAVLSCLTVGLGHGGLTKVSESLGLPSMHKKSYSRHLEAITSITPAIKDDILKWAREKVLEYYRMEEPGAFGEDGILDLAVSYDGTWAKRGHTSKMGVGAIIEIMTGLVIDFHVMSLHCQQCVSVGERLQTQNAGVYEEWLQQHKASGKCTRNYEGSSGGMEVAGARVMWPRSVEHGMRYTTFVGDGDTKTYSALLEPPIYGADVSIVKEECVNHVAKRLNRALRNLVSTMSKQNIRLGGNKRGSLSVPKIGLLQSYYTKAVRMYNSSIEEMSKAIWAGYFHSISTKEHPQHDHCPTGEDTWCWYQRALCSGPVDPDLHTRQQSTFLNSDVAPHVKKVYERLTDPSLLGRCLLGKTQNTNESLHSVVWSICGFRQDLLRGHSSCRRIQYGLLRNAFIFTSYRLHPYLSNHSFRTEERC